MLGACPTVGEPSMQLKSLKVFCDIIRLGSFSKAAELNGVSQPSASQLVHHLEERLGVQLIDRSKRPFVVTDSGKLYYDGCRELVDRFDELENLVKQTHESPGGRLRVASIYSAGLGQMHRVVEEFRAERPRIDLHVDYMHPDKVNQAVLDGTVDLGVVSYPEMGKQLAAASWRNEPFALAVNPSHELAGQSTATLEALAGMPMVMPQAGLRVRDEIDRWLASHRVVAEVAAEFDNFETMKRAIEVGEGVGLLPAQIFAPEAIAGSLVRVDLVDDQGQAETFVRPLGVIHRRGEELSDAAEHFVELLKRHADDPPVQRPIATANGQQATKPATV